MSFNAIALTAKPEYSKLEDVLVRAYMQAASGKGAQRHNLSGETPFHEQRMQTISQLIDSPKGMEYQIIKKLTEGVNLPTHEQRVHELLGAIVYIAGHIIYLNEKEAAKYAKLEAANTAEQPTGGENGPNSQAAMPAPAVKAIRWDDLIEEATTFKNKFGTETLRTLLKLIVATEKLADVQGEKRNMFCEVLRVINNHSDF